MMVMSLGKPFIIYIYLFKKIWVFSQESQALLCYNLFFFQFLAIVRYCDLVNMDFQKLL